MSHVPHVVSLWVAQKAIGVAEQAFDASVYPVLHALQMVAACVAQKTIGVTEHAFAARV